MLYNRDWLEWRLYLVDGMSGLHLHLTRRRVDAVRDLSLDGDQDPTPSHTKAAA